MKLTTLSHLSHRTLVFGFALVLLFSFQMPNYSYSSTELSGVGDNTSIQLIQPSNVTSNATLPSNLTAVDNLSPNTTVSLTPDPGVVNLDLPDSILDLLGSRPPLADQQPNATANLTDTNSTLVTTSNQTQFSGIESVTVLANFTSKPLGLETDYAINGKPLIVVDDLPLNYEYMNDSADEVTISDMLVSLRASIKLDNSTASIPEQLRIFSNPSNVTENPDGSRTYINDATTIDNLEIAGVIFSEATTVATVYPNGTGTINSTNIQ
ncbi:MAG TPA: hypothetical protein VD815_04130 [Candidatus Saccharimonadales bacterium]|nr:hypothetical protein [Candidatus Saccharimonadales bacterium]